MLFMLVVGPWCHRAIGPSNEALREFAEKLLRHAAHGAGRSGLSVGSEVLDDHRQDGGERHLHNLRGDAGFLSGLFDEAGAAEALLDLFGSCGGGLTGAPGVDMLGHAVIFEGIEDALNALRMLSEGFDKASGYLGLIGSGGSSGLSGE
jgi:hypothetical protein